MLSKLETRAGMLSESHKRKNPYNFPAWIVQLVDISATSCLTFLFPPSVSGISLSATACCADHLQWGCSVVRLAKARHIQLPRVQQMQGFG